MPDMNPLDEAWGRYYRTAEKVKRRQKRVYVPIMALGLALWAVMIIVFETFNGVSLLALLMMFVPAIFVMVDQRKADRALRSVREEIDLEAPLRIVREEGR